MAFAMTELWQNYRVTARALAVRTRYPEFLENTLGFICRSRVVSISPASADIATELMNCAGILMTSMPFWNLTPWTTFGN